MAERTMSTAPAASRGRGLVGRTAVAAAVTLLAVATSAMTAPADVDGLRGSEWALTALKAEQAWQTSKGTGVTVAVIGSGVDASHPDLEGRVLKGADLGDGSTADGTRDQGPQDQQGTHAAGIIAATGRNYHGGGVYGLAPEARVLPLRVHRNDTPVPSATAKAVRYAVDHGARVIDVTVGFTKPSDALRSAIEYALGRNAVIVTGAGDNGRTGDQVTYPAAYPGVVAVAATDKKGAVWPASHHGEHVTLTAPGVDILTTAPGGDYWTGSGTQYAASWVAASAVLLRAEHPRWTGDQVVRKLTGAASHEASSGRDPRQGFGTVAPAAALADRTAPSDSAAHPAVPAADTTADGRDSLADRPEDPAAYLALAAMGAGLIVLAAIAWFLIRRSASPFDPFDPSGD
ncbi:S8 family serine peptidase [Streptomyces canus]|uniref:S8 family serine peptidase n=1 Tax=Streptomyces canus TaxID=58343 RepID=UPI00381011A0